VEKSVKERRREREGERSKERDKIIKKTLCSVNSLTCGRKKYVVIKPKKYS
jgi:hypothetical protein